MLTGETVSPTRLISQYTKVFSNSDKLRAFIVPKMTYLIKFLDNNAKSAVYMGGDIHGIYRYLEIIGDPTTFTTSGQRSHHFSPSPSVKNYTAYIQPVIADIRTKKKIICKCCGIIGHKADACIICGPRFLSLSLRRKVYNFNSLHGDEPNEPPREWSIQPPADYFKYSTSSSNTISVVSSTTGKLNHHEIDNVGVKVHTSDFPVEFNSESVPDLDTTPIKSIGDELITMPLIIVMLRFTLQIFQLNLTLNQFQIQTPLRLNQLMMMKCIISWNSFIQNMMKIFWMLTSRCFKLDWWPSSFKILYILYYVVS